MKRVIEISAKSQEEAQQMANREISPGEKIVASEVLMAPTKGMFGVVGNPEFRIRYTIDSTPIVAAQEIIPARSPRAPEAETRPADVQKTWVEPAEAYPRDGVYTPKKPGMAPVFGGHHADDDLDSEEPFSGSGDEGERSERVHATRKYSIECVGTDHPAHDQIFNVVKLVGGTVGIAELKLSERIEEDAWIIEVEGKDAALMIGKHGKTLDSLQYIVNIIANKGRDSRVKIVLDVQGYREQRHKGLVQLANRMYRKVVDTRRQVELEPMSTVDRRTVHLALKDRAGIETYSRGVEPLRRVVIAPKKAGQPHSGGGGRHQEPREQRGPSKPRAMPMFMEEDGSKNE